MSPFTRVHLALHPARLRRRAIPRLLAAAAALVAVGAVQLPVAAAPARPEAAAAVRPDAGFQVPANAVMGSVSYTEATVFAPGLSTKFVGTWASGGHYFVCAAGGTGAAMVQAAINVPAGSKLYRLDFYGYTSGTGSSMPWSLLDLNVASGTTASLYSSTILTEGVTDDPVGWSSGLTIAAGHQLLLRATTTSCIHGFVGATFQYVAPAPLTYVPIVPARVYDSRFADGKLATGATRTLTVATSTASGHPTVVPAGAVAVTYNLTVVDTAAKGFLALYPAGTAFPNNSSINWFGADQILANGGTVALGSNLQVAVRAGGTGASTNFVVDITGYYKP